MAGRKVYTAEEIIALASSAVRHPERLTHAEIKTLADTVIVKDREIHRLRDLLP